MFFDKVQSTQAQATCFVSVYRYNYPLKINDIFDGEHNFWIKDQFDLTRECIKSSLADACYYIKRLGSPQRGMRYIFEVGCSAEDLCRLLRNDSDGFHRLIRCAYNADDIIKAARQKSTNMCRTLHPSFIKQVDLTSKSIERHVNPNYSRIAAKLTNLCEASSRWSPCAIL